MSTPTPIHAAPTASWRSILLALAAAACFLPQVTPAGALAIGLVLAVAGLAPHDKRLGKWAKLLIQVGVVLMGLSMNLNELAKAGLVGVAFAAGTIVGTIAVGALVGRLLRCEDKLTALLSAGTAICGGSAIAAVGSVIAATQAQIAVAMGAVFLLNAIALYLFPFLGHAIGLTQDQFGTWAAVAIHDVSSVVGASTAFDRAYHTAGPWPDRALQVATAVKLTRTLWIAPVAVLMAWWFARRATDSAPAAGRRLNVPIPWFVLWFAVAAALGTYIPALAPAIKPTAWVAKHLMAVALLLIGCGLSVQAIMNVGWRAVTLAITLWVFISAAALVVVKLTIHE